MAVSKLLISLFSVLRVETQPVDLDNLASPEMTFLFGAMKKSLDNYDAVGVSAPQLGVPLKVFAVQITQKQIDGWSPETILQRNLKPIPCRFFINPVLKIINSEHVVDREGCCSVYGYSALVTRAKEVEVRAFDETGKPVQWIARDWTARVVQHEMDHLKGETGRRNNSSLFRLNQGNLIQGKARLALKNWKNLFGDQREDSLTSLEVCFSLQ